MTTILIADDHAVTREPLARLLRYEGYETVTAANGLEALDLLRTRRPDLVLLDLMMPKMNGVAFLEAAAREAAASDGNCGGEGGSSRSLGVPVLLLTGASECSDLVRARELGATEVVYKSRFSLDQLLGRIRAHLPPPPEPASLDPGSRDPVRAA